MNRGSSSNIWNANEVLYIGVVVLLLLYINAFELVCDDSVAIVIYDKTPN